MKTSANGFTLIEVLIAIAIFSIGILAVASLQTSALNQTRSSRITTECLTLATQHAERLKSLPFYTTEFTAHPVDLNAGNHNVNDDVNNPRYEIRWTVQDNEPIGQQPNIWQDPAVPADITVSKTISIEVSPINNPNDIRAALEFVKVWSVD
jgi:prepilin-type N-terminal cleavage/methylation domain-containing protein